MDFNPLTALSPLDGRYASKVDALREHFSEFGLIKSRLKVVDRSRARCADRQLQPGTGRRGEGYRSDHQP